MPLALKPRFNAALAVEWGHEAKRTYLVVVDDSAEARVALRFAARRAAKTNGRIEVLGIVEPQDFVQFGGVQAAIEEEQRLRIEGVVSVGDRRNPRRVGSRGEHHRPARASRCERSATIIGEREEVAALVLGAAPSGSPGPLVANFTGNDAGQAALPGDDHPGIAQRRAAGAAELRADSRLARIFARDFGRSASLVLFA